MKFSIKLHSYPKLLFPHLFGNLLFTLLLETTILCLVSSPPWYHITQPHRTDLQRHGQTPLHFLSRHLETEFILIVLADSWPLNSGWCSYTRSDIKPTSTKPFKTKFELEESLYRISLCMMLLPHVKSEFQRQRPVLLDCGTSMSSHLRSEPI